jgi:hypothetical protein
MRHFPVSPAAAERTKVAGGRRCFIASDDRLDAQGQRTIRGATLSLEAPGAPDRQEKVNKAYIA